MPLPFLVASDLRATGNQGVFACKASVMGLKAGLFPWGDRDGRGQWLSAPLGALHLRRIRHLRGRGLSAERGPGGLGFVRLSGPRIQISGSLGALAGGLRRAYVRTD